MTANDEFERKDYYPACCTFVLTDDFQTFGSGVEMDAR